MLKAALGTQSLEARYDTTSLLKNICSDGPLSALSYHSAQDFKSFLWVQSSHSHMPELSLKLKKTFLLRVILRQEYLAPSMSPRYDHGYLNSIKLLIEEITIKLHRSC